MSDTTDQAPAGLNTSVPHVARVYDYWLGGKSNYPPDRALGEKIKELMPGIVAGVRANRAFLGRAVHHLAAEERIRQFLDVGTGLPAANNTHEVAQRVAPESRIVYVDNDPIVLVHAQALLTSTPEGRCDYIDADVRDPERILREAARTLDFHQPVALMLVALLHCVEDDDKPYEIVRTLVDALPSGSFLVLSHGASDVDDAMLTSAQTVNQAMPDKVQPRSREEVTRFFDGLDLLAPGVVSTTQWRPGPGVAATRLPMWAGVARKP